MTAIINTEQILNILSYFEEHPTQHLEHRKHSIINDITNEISYTLTYFRGTKLF